MFSPGETVVHRFNIPFIASELAKVIISYKQGDDIIFEKTITSGFEELDVIKTKITIVFTQTESLLFKELRDYTIQVNVLTKTGTRATSKIIKGKSSAQYHKEVIDDV